MKGVYFTMPHNYRFTTEEINFITNNYKELSVKEIAKTLGRSLKGTRAKIERLNLNLSNLKRNQPHEWTEYELNYLNDNYRTMSDAKIGCALNMSPTKIFYKRIELGLTKHKYEPYIANEYTYQYIDGKRVCLHRNVMENHLGRSLTKEERVHHIDGDKTNYSLDNLYLCENRSKHMLVHASLETIAFELVKQGVIKFDKSLGKYHL